jgi:hypothetical protein
MVLPPPGIAGEPLVCTRMPRAVHGSIVQVLFKNVAAMSVALIPLVKSPTHTYVFKLHCNQASILLVVHSTSQSMIAKK